ncbi:MAG: DNA repair protein RecO [candidate division Zixibacteria bacterium RBG_16_53_22]|nr:MAG: DNA repair protein RecO [candidate division Zixibacteria bacterium RBG_16_53_22]
MARYKIEAFIIRTSRMTESSRLVTFYSREMGKVKGVAKGVGRPRSRLGGKVELFNLIEADFYKKETTELGILSGAHLINDFKGISEEPRRYGFGSAWCEVLDRASQPEEPHPDIFDLTYDFLDKLRSARPEAAGLLFWSALFKFITVSGYAPGLEACVSCGTEIETDRLMISFQRGGLVCPKCVEPDEPIMPITRETLDLLDRMLASPLAQLALAEINPKTGRQAAEVVLSLGAYHIGLPRNLKSFKFLDKLTDSGKPGR